MSWLLICRDPKLCVQQHIAVGKVRDAAARSACGIKKALMQSCVPAEIIFGYAVGLDVPAGIITNMHLV
jgi:hypothetical protein